MDRMLQPEVEVRPTSAYNIFVEALFSPDCMAVIA